MTFQGHVENDVIVLDDSEMLPEGAQVTITLTVEPPLESQDSLPSFAGRFASVIGTVQGLPEDFAENHDHYLYGVRK